MRATAEASAAQDVEDDVEDGDNNLGELMSDVGRSQSTGWVLTVTITETMIIRTSAIAAITALIAPPIAEKMAPYEVEVSSEGYLHRA